MKFETAFDIGDTAWIYFGRYDTRPQEATIGRIGVEKTGYMDYITTEAYVDTYKEVYMCTETGIGCGTLHTLGEHIFKTREECEAKYADKIAKDVADKAEQAAREVAKKLGEEAMLRRKLAEIEKIKGETNGNT